MSISRVARHAPDGKCESPESEKRLQRTRSGPNIPESKRKHARFTLRLKPSASAAIRAISDNMGLCRSEVAERLFLRAFYQMGNAENMKRWATVEHLLLGQTSSRTGAPLWPNVKDEHVAMLRQIIDHAVQTMTHGDERDWKHLVRVHGMLFGKNRCRDVVLHLVEDILSLIREGTFNVATAAHMLVETLSKSTVLEKIDREKFGALAPWKVQRILRNGSPAFKGGRLPDHVTIASKLAIEADAWGVGGCVDVSPGKPPTQRALREAVKIVRRDLLHACRAVCGGSSKTS